MSIRRLRDRWGRWFAARPRLRVPLAVALVLALGVGGWQAYVRLTDDDGPREWTKGPYGKAPAALGRTAPARPGEMVRRLDQVPEAIVGGLALYDDRSRAGMTRLTAVGLRTNRTYWEYGREANLYTLGFGDDLAVLSWHEGGLTAVDLRTGEPRWHTEVPRADPDGFRSPTTILRVTDQVVLAETDEEVWALSAADGKRRWRAVPPKGCKRWFTVDEPLALREVYVLEADGCAYDPDLYPDPHAARMAQVALDADTGAVRWRFPHDAHRLGYLPANDTTMVLAPVRRDGGGMAVTDVSRRRPSTRTLPFPDGEGAHGTTAHTLVAQGGADRGTLRGYALDDGRRRWTYQAAKGTRLGSAVVADGRVYVVEQPPQEEGRPPPAGPSRLLVLDAERGGLLYSLNLPELDRNGNGDPHQLEPSLAGDGVVAVSWNQSPSTGADLLLLTDARP